MKMLIPSLCYIIFSIIYYKIGFKILKQIEDELTKIVFAYCCMLLVFPFSILILTFGEIIAENLLK